MLAVVKKPHIELSIQGENPSELLAWIRRKFVVTIVSPAASSSIPIEETDFYREMEQNRIGNLIAGARLKAELTQAQLAEKAGIRQNMVSDYENGKRNPSRAMLRKLSAAVGRDLVTVLDEISGE
ncbi:MAG: helix-turn-helix transcriptional regulator [Kiritimatiellae bacterium]|nr:helix-turn-helix transcriptional regulator [Kiritimatiellia bacterium]MDD4736340.1 helix-turn-helix transcriptional regulator [Kiritimatiellia bacterium]